jgi:hypothetical protein
LTRATTIFDPRSWFALYRYAGEFEGSEPQLRLVGDMGDMDPRLKAILGEEMATGITTYLLREHFEVDHIADVYNLIGTHVAYVPGAIDEKRPDYYCIDGANEVVFAESKGAIGTKVSITGGLNYGQEQVANVVSTTRQTRASCGRAVIGTHFCIAGVHPRSETTTIIRDPLGPRGGDHEGEDNDLPIRYAYAKVLKFCNQHLIADRLILGMPWDAPVFNTVRFSEQDFILLGGSPFGGVICMLRGVYDVLSTSNQGNLFRRLSQYLGEFRVGRASMDDAIKLPNGIIVL